MKLFRCFSTVYLFSNQISLSADEPLLLLLLLLVNRTDKQICSVELIQSQWSEQIGCLFSGGGTLQRLYTQHSHNQHNCSCSMKQTQRFIQGVASHKYLLKSTPSTWWHSTATCLIHSLQLKQEHSITSYTNRCIFILFLFLFRALE